MRPFPTNLIDNIDGVGMSCLLIGKTLYEEIYTAFMPLQRKNELQQMLKIGQSVRPKTVMEIGTANGGGLAHWCLSMQPSLKRVIACEIRGTPYYQVFEDAFPQLDFCWVDRGSCKPQAVEQVKQWLGKDQIDILFIDGDKGRFIDDFYTYSPLISIQGVIFFHDIQRGQTQSDYERVAKAMPGCVRILDTTEAVDAVIRQRAGIDPVDQYEGWLRHWKGQSAGVGVIWMG